MKKRVVTNIGSSSQLREITIGATLDEHERAQLKELLKEFVDVFAWSYVDMSDIDPEISQHEIPTLPDYKPIKQKLRKLRTEWSLKVKEEVVKQLNVGFIRVIEYPTWLANIVLVPKSGGKVSMCVDN